jgi:hypothetical protein
MSTIAIRKILREEAEISAVAEHLVAGRRRTDGRALVNGQRALVIGNAPIQLSRPTIDY